MIGCARTGPANPAHGTELVGDPLRVTIAGYDGDAMESFLSRDALYLFFNDLHDPAVDTKLHWAERVADSTFHYRGEISGVNSSALDAVAPMDRAGVFYFVSTRSYDQTTLSEEAVAGG